MNIARRSTFENANMIMALHFRGLLDVETRDSLLADLDEECRMLTGFMKGLKKD